MDSEFDQFGDTYDVEVQKALGVCAGSHDFFTAVKAAHVIRLARKYLGAPIRLSVLDLGCGGGLTVARIAGAFQAVSGADVSEKLIAKARALSPACAFRVCDGRSLPAADHTYDLVYSINVFHHVPLANRLPLLREMHRVTKAGGRVLLFEHNPYNPLTMRTVRACAFDADAVLLTCAESRRLLRDAGLGRICSGYILFLPCWVRLSVLVDRLLGWLPAGAQYYAMGEKTR